MATTSARAPRIPAPTRVLTLLCAMYFINYIVRVNVSTASAVFQPELHLTNTQVGLIFSAFAYPYLCFQVAGGWVADKFGARRSLTVFAILWSTATVLMGLTSTLGGMLLGIVEALGAGYIGDFTNNVFGSNYQDVFAFLVLIGVLVFRPSGLLGERIGDRA